MMGTWNQLPLSKEATSSSQGQNFPSVTIIIIGWGCDLSRDEHNLKQSCVYAPYILK